MAYILIYFLLKINLPIGGTHRPTHDNIFVGVADIEQFGMVVVGDGYESGYVGLVVENTIFRI